MGRDAAEMPLAIESLKIWRGLKAQFGADTGYRETGITYLCSDRRETREAEGWAETGQRYDLPQRILDKREIAELLPGASSRFTFGLHTSSDGRAEPGLAAPAIVRAAADRGAIVATVAPCGDSKRRREGLRRRLLKRGRYAAQPSSSPAVLGHGSFSATSVSTSRN